MTGTVYIEYGFGEGAWHGATLVECLRDHNFKLTSDPDEATVIIAHSGGSYLIPAEREYACIMHVNLTYYAANHYARKIVSKTHRDARALRRQNRLMYFFHKSLRNFGYMLQRPDRALRMYKATRKQVLPPLNARKIMIIRNQNDPWLIEDIHEVYEGQKLSFISFPGEHDDLWECPEHYVELLRSI